MCLWLCCQAAGVSLSRSYTEIFLSCLQDTYILTRTCTHTETPSLPLSIFARSVFASRLKLYQLNVMCVLASKEVSGLGLISMCLLVSCQYILLLPPAVPVLACGGDNSQVHLYTLSNKQVSSQNCFIYQS